MPKFLKEPLLHFLLLGGALFLLFRLTGGTNEADGGDAQSQDTATQRSISNEIVVSTGQIESLVAQFEKVWQRAPTTQELTGLIEKFVRDEVLYREALKLELDRDDPIVRRRMGQKLEFFTEDIIALAKPTTKDLTDYLEAHPDAYRLESTFTFKQVYLDAKKRGEGIDADLAALLESLRADGASADISEAGDALILDQFYLANSQHDISRLFGREFAQGLLKAPTGTWHGPVKSGYGIHLVFISELIEGRSPPLETVREAVERDWTAAKRKETNEALYQKWRARYTVEVAELPASEEVSSK